MIDTGSSTPLLGPSDMDIRAARIAGFSKHASTEDERMTHFGTSAKYLDALAKSNHSADGST